MGGTPWIEGIPLECVAASRIGSDQILTYETAQILCGESTASPALIGSSPTFSICLLMVNSHNTSLQRHVNC